MGKFCQFIVYGGKHLKESGYNCKEKHLLCAQQTGIGLLQIVKQTKHAKIPRNHPTLFRHDICINHFGHNFSH